MSEFSDKVRDVIDVLSEKFGKTGEALWAVLIRQQIVEAIIGTVQGVAIILIDLLILYPWAMYILQGMSSCGDPVCSDNIQFAWLPLGAIALILNIALFMVFENVVTNLANPEYGAMQDIVSNIKD